MTSEIDDEVKKAVAIYKNLWHCLDALWKAGLGESIGADVLRDAMGDPWLTIVRAPGGREMLGEIEEVDRDTIPTEGWG